MRKKEKNGKGKSIYKKVREIKKICERLRDKMRKIKRWKMRETYEENVRKKCIKDEESKKWK